MNEQQQHALVVRQTDIEGALRRMSGNADFYSLCLRAFLEDRTVEQMNNAIDNSSWDDAFTAAHALKGLAGNMGFLPLMHKTAQLIVLIRRGQRSEIQISVEQVNSAYRDIVDGINQYFSYENE